MIHILFLFAMSQGAMTTDGLQIYQELDEIGEYRLTNDNALIYKVKEEKCENSESDEK